MIVRSVLSESVIGVGAIPNQPLPAVGSCCLRGALRKEEEKEVGILEGRVLVFFCTASEDGVLTFLAATAGSNVASFLLRMEIDGLIMVASRCSARLRSCERLTPDIPLSDFASSCIGAV